MAIAGSFPRLAINRVLESRTRVTFYQKKKAKRLPSTLRSSFAGRRLPEASNCVTGFRKSTPTPYPCHSSASAV